MAAPGGVTNDGPADWGLDDKVAVVTGAGASIGRGIAVTLAEAGAIVVCADGVFDAARCTAEAIVDAGGRAEAVVLDVMDKSMFDQVVRDVAKQQGHLDILCNLAGNAEAAPIVELDESSFDATFDTHFKGTLFGCQAALDVMSPAGRGAIVNLSSAAIDSAPESSGAFAIAKASISMLTRVLAGEAGRSGIRVNALAPGLTAQPSHPAAAGQWDRLGTAESEAAPLGRVSVDDLTILALYLASDASRFVTGQTLRINGGSAMPW